MDKRPKHVTKEKNHPRISKRKKKSSSISMKNTEPIPIDLIIEVLSRLPVKSIARFRCVSKHWNLIVRSLDFTSLFLTVSNSRPRLLFAVQQKGKWLFFSTPQPLNQDNNSYTLVADSYTSFPMIKCSSALHAPVNGFLCTKNIWLRRGCNKSKVMIYNPSTGQSISLPIMRRRRADVRTYFGYDPVNKKYKVLCMSLCRNPLKAAADEHQVLTLGTKKPSWKRIECSLPHFPDISICINGVLFYLAFHRPQDDDGSVACFDIRSETFKFIRVDNKITCPSRLINHTGKLGVIYNTFEYFTGKTTSIELLVLDDLDKDEWSQYIFILPPLWKDLVADMVLDIVGMISNGELVFSPKDVHDPFYIFFYNVEKNTITRVEIQGMKSSMTRCIHSFIDHVEDVKLM